MMGTAFTGARIRHVVWFILIPFYLKHIVQHYYFNLFFVSLLRRVLVRPRYQNINSFGFKKTSSGGVKRFILVFKTSTNYSIALISVVFSFNRAYTILNLSSLILNRLWISSLANNYIKPIQTIRHTSSTYTFNSVKNDLTTIKGEIKKKTTLFKSKRLNNISAPKLTNLSKNITHATDFALVNYKKNYHPIPTIVSHFKETCKVSLSTILFIEKMNKIEDIKSSLYKTAFSINSLLVAYYQIRSKFSNITSRQTAET
jgi:hypothetical protein